MVVLKVPVPGPALILVLLTVGVRGLPALQQIPFSKTGPPPVDVTVPPVAAENGVKLWAGLVVTIGAGSVLKLSISP